MGISSAGATNEVYTGTLQYEDDEYMFVLSNGELRLIPVLEEKRESMWKFAKKEIAKGVYIQGDIPRMQQDVLVGYCNENGKKIIFLPKKVEYISKENVVLIVDLEAYIICKSSYNSIDRIRFNGPEINCIHPTNLAVDRTLNIDTFNANGVFSVTAKDYASTTTQKQKFAVDGKNVSIHFDVSRTMSKKNWEPPMTLLSEMVFDFDATEDYRFILNLWYIAKQFVQLLCYRKNIRYSKVELAAPCEEGKHERFAELYVLSDEMETEIQTLKDGRYIKQLYIAGYEGQILSDIANNKLYLRHLPESFQYGQRIDAARFVMITAAFEWEFDRLYPHGIPKSKQRAEAELKASQKLNKLIEANTGKLKTIYKALLKCIERKPNLANKVEKIGSDMGEILKPFGTQLYEVLNKEHLNYGDMGKRLADQRNHFAHGDLDKDFIGLSLLDLVFLQQIVYAIQLKVSGVEDRRIQRAINDLFKHRFILE